LLCQVAGGWLREKQSADASAHRIRRQWPIDEFHSKVSANRLSSSNLHITHSPIAFVMDKSVLNFNLRDSLSFNQIKLKPRMACLPFSRAAFLVLVKKRLFLSIVCLHIDKKTVRNRPSSLCVESRIFILEFGLIGEVRVTHDGGQQS
jgi:hypothetical protein